MADPTCQHILQDLYQNRSWSAAHQLTLIDKAVVAARQSPLSPLVIFIPVSGDVKVADLGLYVDRARQLAVDVSTGHIVLEVVASEGKLSRPDNSDHVKPGIGSTERFVVDLYFNRDKCLKLHQDIRNKQLEYERSRELRERKKARVEEIRLGLMDEDEVATSHGPKNSLSKSDNELDRTADFYTSVMFAISESGTVSYFLAASGLAPPDLCPEDSDDEKPLDVILQEQKRTLNKRSLGEG